MVVSHVKYRGKTYRVLASNYLGFPGMLKLASRTAGGSPFGVFSGHCVPVYRKTRRQA